MTSSCICLHLMFLKSVIDHEPLSSLPANSACFFLSKRASSSLLLCRHEKLSIGRGKWCISSINIKPPAYGKSGAAWSKINIIQCTWLTHKLRTQFSNIHKLLRSVKAALQSAWSTGTDRQSSSQSMVHFNNYIPLINGLAVWRQYSSLATDCPHRWRF